MATETSLEAAWTPEKQEAHNANEDGSRGPQLLDRTFSILGLFSHETPEWTTTEAARACDLPVPTVHRIFLALERYGYVARDQETRRFRLGSTAIEMGRVARAAMGLRSVSMPILERLATETGETALLTALNRDRNRGLCLDRVDSQHDLRLSVVPDRQNFLHAGASQKALLSYLIDEELDAVISAGLPAICRATITDPEELRLALQEIREKGWASSYEETNLGVWGIAITLLDTQGSAVAAVGLAGPRVRMPKAKVAMVVEVLRYGAADIAATLGLKTSLQPEEVSRVGSRRRHEPVHK